MKNLEAAIKKHNIAVKSKFVPFSQSRSKDQKDPNFNWRVTLTMNGREVLTT